MARGPEMSPEPSARHRGAWLRISRGDERLLIAFGHPMLALRLSALILASQLVSRALRMRVAVSEDSFPAVIARKVLKMSHLRSWW